MDNCINIGYRINVENYTIIICSSLICHSIHHAIACLEQTSIRVVAICIIMEVIFVCISICCGIQTEDYSIAVCPAGCGDSIHFAIIGKEQIHSWMDAMCGIKFINVDVSAVYGIVFKNYT